LAIPINMPLQACMDAPGNLHRVMESGFRFLWPDHYYAPNEVQKKLPGRAADSFCVGFIFNFSHHLADISQASAAFGVFPSAIAFPGFLFSRYSLENQGAPIFDVILLDLFFRILKAVAHQIIVFEVIYF